MQARFYLPWVGRFGSPDPARDQHFEQTQSWNIYSYVQNSPTMHLDPNGQETTLAIGGPVHDNMFGHSAMIINGKVYSYGTNDTKGAPRQRDWGASAKAYLDAENGKGRATTLMKLDLTPKQEAELQKHFDSNNPNAKGADPYSVAGNSCVTVLAKGLEKVGVSTQVPSGSGAIATTLPPPTRPAATPGELKTAVETSGKVKSETTTGEQKTSWIKAALGTLKHAVGL